MRVQGWSNTKFKIVNSKLNMYIKIKANGDLIIVSSTKIRERKDTLVDF